MKSEKSTRLPGLTSKHLGGLRFLVGSKERARTGVVLETVESHLSISADLDDVTVGITHVAAPFPAVIIQRLGEKGHPFVSPLLVAGPDVCNTQIKEAIHSVYIRRCFKDDLRFVGSRPTPGIENDPGVSQLDVARIFWLDHFPTKNSDIEVLRFFLVPDREEVRGEETFVWNWRVG